MSFPPEPAHEIWVEDSVTHEAYMAFRWSRDPDAGIARAHIDAQAHGRPIDRAWAQPILQEAQ